MQSRRQSVIEATINTASGFVLSYAVGFLVFPLFGFQVSASENLGIVSIYTVISILRSYFWRRVFNWWHGAASSESMGNTAEELWELHRRELDILNRPYEP